MSQEKPEPQYFSRSEFISALEENIEQLQSILARVRRESIDTWPESSILEDLKQTTGQLNHSLVTTPVPEPEAGLDGVLPSFNSLENWWDRVLARVRSLLPPNLRSQVPDWLITGVLSTTVVALLLGLVLLISPPQPSPQVAEIEPTPELIPDNPLELPTPEPQLILPENPTPAPEPQLTPEQKLVTALQSALDNLIGSYAPATVAAIRADFDNSKLLVTIGEGWAALSPQEQERIANDIWQRSRRLDFKNLEIVNQEETVIARSPVVGERVIILEKLRL